jgi:hypothetical protein
MLLDLVLNFLFTALAAYVGAMIALQTYFEDDEGLVFRTGAPPDYGDGGAGTETKRDDAGDGGATGSE